MLIFAPEGGYDHFLAISHCWLQGPRSVLYPELRLAFPHASMGQAIADFQADIIHVVDPALLGMAGLYYGGGKNGGALRLPLVISYHTDLPKYAHYYRLKFMEPWRGRLSAGVTIAPRSTCAPRRPWWISCSGMEFRRLGLWPGGVDTDRFQRNRCSAEMRARLSDGHPEDPLFLYVGRLSPEKEINGLG